MKLLGAVGLAAVAGLLAWLVLHQTGGASVPPPAERNQGTAAPAAEPASEVAMQGSQVAAAGADAETQRRVPMPTGAAAGSDLLQGVRGVAVDAAGRPLPGVRTFLVEAPDNNPFAQWQALQHGVPLLPSAQAVTEADGTFALGVRQAGSKRYEVRLLSEQHADGRAGPIQILPGDWFDAGQVQLLPGAVVRGRVTIAGTQLPVPAATVTLLSGNAFEQMTMASLPGRELGLRVTTDASGYYELRNAPRQGLWTLQALAPGFARANRPQIELRTDQAVQVDFELQRGQSIAGRVTDSDGRPIAEARIQALALQGDATAVDCVTDRTGLFEAAGLREGPHRLRVTARGFQTRDEPQVAAGSQGLHLILERTGTARVRVRTPDGQILGRYTVVLLRWFPHNGGQIASVPTIADVSVRPDDLTDGAATVTGLERGTYAVHVLADTWAKTLSDPFDIGAGPAPLVEVTVTRGATLSGRVVDEAGQPVTGAEVATQAEGSTEDNPFHRMLASLSPDRITRTSVRTDQNGRYRLERLALADYQLKIVHPDHCEAMLRGIAIAAPGERQAPDAVLARGTVVQGRTFVDGVPAGQVKVVIGPPPDHAANLTPEAALVRAEAISNNDGTFAVARRLPPGTYEIKAAQQAGDAAGAGIFLQLLQFRQTSTNFAVAPGQTTAEINLHIVTTR